MLKIKKKRIKYKLKTSNAQLNVDIQSTKTRNTIQKESYTD